MTTPLDVLTAIIEDCEVPHAEAERLAEEALRGRHVSEELAMYLEVRQIDRDIVQELLDASVFVAQGLALHDDMEVRLLARMEAINAKYAALHAAPNPERSDA